MSSLWTTRRMSSLWFFAVLLIAVGTRDCAAGLFDALSHDALDALCSDQYNCSCPQSEADTILECAHRQIKKLPDQITLGTSIKRVHLQDNEITSISESSFYSGDVLVLDLSHNQIKSLASKAFSELRSLQQLFLQHNKIWTLPLSPFDGLSKLETLDLSYNQLELINSDVFKPLKSLKELKLSHNQLVFHFDTFSYTPVLERLYIDNNEIHRMDAVQSLPKTIKHLILRENPLEVIPTELLAKCPKLLMLDLSEIAVQKLKPGDFKGISNLTTLYLNQLPYVEEFEPYTFCGLNNLRSFQSYRNPKLMKIDPDAFRCKESSTPINISELVLRDNALLKSLPENLLDWKNVSNLDLTGNPWKCDCKLKWLPKVKVPKQHVSRMRCEYPERHADKIIQMIDPEDMKCGLDLSSDVVTTLGLLVVIVFCMVLTGILVMAYKRACCFRRRSSQGKYVRVKASKDKVDLEWDNTAEP